MIRSIAAGAAVAALLAIPGTSANANSCVTWREVVSVQYRTVTLPAPYNVRVPLMRDVWRVHSSCSYDTFKFSRWIVRGK